MASIRHRDGKLFFDFRYRGIRCRELTRLPDTPANRRRMETVLKRIQRDIALGRFDYARYFPASPMAARFREPGPAARAGVGVAATRPATPLFRDFALTWLHNKSVEWRQSYRDSVAQILKTHLLPAFGELPLEQIDRAAVLDFRTALAGDDPRRRRPRAPATVNRILGILSLLLDEAALSHDLPNPCQGIKRLKVKKIDIQPFSLEEVRLLIERVRPDFADYLRVRFFTGMRSGEVNGLKWEHVDFERNEIRIRETWVNGRTEYTKTDGSQREICMSPPVREALLRMEKLTRPLGPYVFCTPNGRPIDNHNFVNRVWNPLLRHLGLKPRRPYQMRHTCATLWLAAGENPQWIARQLGHTTTEMLFRTYARFVPNLTRRDGSAFDRMLTAALNGGLSETLAGHPAKTSAGRADTEARHG
ncbi:MAG: DUF3596 domain-containing protein [Sinobacteraceae bacterium]|nr:DUF3596 domain-containing protein [Nevskiaceae bacterium]